MVCTKYKTHAMCTNSHGEEAARVCVLLDDGVR